MTAGPKLGSQRTKAHDAAAAHGADQHDKRASSGERMHVLLETSLTGSKLLLDMTSVDHVLFGTDVLYAVEMTGKQLSHGTDNVKLA